MNSIIEDKIFKYLNKQSIGLLWLTYKIYDGNLWISTHYCTQVLKIDDPDLFKKIKQIAKHEKDLYRGK